MIAIDTNILVRVVTQDDPAQSPKAAEVLKSPKIWLPKTVLLETAWVLEHAYDLPKSTVIATLRLIIGYENMVVEGAAEATRALAWTEGGMDFADALHLASSQSADEFVTFDDGLARRARSLHGIRVRLAG